MSRQTVIRQIVQRDQQQRALNEEAVQREAPQLHELACETFGTWETALQYAGVSWRRANRVPAYTPARVIQELRRLCRHGYSLASRRVRQRHRHLHEAALRHFGAWRRALESAGIDARNAFQRVPNNKQRLVETLLRRQELGLSLRRNEVFLEHRALAVAVKQAFGSWRKALAAAGIEPGRVADVQRQLDRQQAVEAIQRRHREGKPLTRAATRSDDPALITVACRCFGSWSKAIAAAGVDTFRRGRRSTQVE